MSYCKDLFNYQRRKSQEVCIGKLRLGGDAPVRIQSMTNTSTLDTAACVKQAKAIIDAGGDLVRLTAQGVKEAENLTDIRRELNKDGYGQPLVADIHFNPKAAEAAASRVEKVRINPGNFADPMPAGIQCEEDVQKAIRERFVPFLNLCKEHHTAIRIGVNHGSLSARMMKRYGDTPQGMVASCMEYLRICVEENFLNVVISIKASNTLIMVQTVRLLVQEMDKEDMHFPLHLGVTEAGDGEDGRIKSAVGIGALLADGIGDTIRVSLSEDPQAEIPVAIQLRDHIVQRAGHEAIPAQPYEGFDAFSFHRRKTYRTANIGDGQQPVVVAQGLPAAGGGQASGATTTAQDALQADFYYLGHALPASLPAGHAYICDLDAYSSAADQPLYPLGCVQQWDVLQRCPAAIKFLKLRYQDLNNDLVARLSGQQDIVLVLESSSPNPVGEMRAVFHYLLRQHCLCPIVLKAEMQVPRLEQLQLFAAADFGALLIDGFGDGLWLDAPRQSQAESISTMLSILQATRLRISRTEYISCPSCGRTLFDLQQTIAHVKAGTAHLKGLKIAIMGCIVNGPGEMADADYGYVGAGRGKVSLYKAQTCIEKNIPQEEALERLLELIRKDNR